MKKREIYKIIISEEAKRRINEDRCPSCGKPKKDWNRRTDWKCCSVECTERFEKDKIIRSWPELRWKAFKRDNFTCQYCKTKPIKIAENINMGDKDFKKYAEKYYRVITYYKEKKKEKNRLQAIIIDDSRLIGDHIKPISLGGDEWDLKNVQTLCESCNKRKTRSDAFWIAKQRRIEKKLIKGQKELK